MSRAERRHLIRLRKAVAGNRRAFSLLWKQFEPMLRGILLSMLPDQEVDDLMQEVALRAWKGVQSLNRAEKFSPWLCAIARNVGRTALERRKSGSASGEAHADLGVDVVAASGTSPSGATEADEIMDCIRSLPEAYREPITLRLLFDFDGPEIAHHTGLTPGSVRVNLCRGMVLLRRELTSRGVSP